MQGMHYNFVLFLGSFQEYFLGIYTGDKPPHCMLMKNGRTKRPRGFGFVTYSTVEEAEEVIKIDHVIDGKPVGIQAHR